MNSKALTALRNLAARVRRVAPASRACLGVLLAFALILSSLHTTAIAEVLDINPSPASQEQEQQQQQQDPAAQAAASEEAVPEAAPAEQPATPDAAPQEPAAQAPQAGTDEGEAPQTAVAAAASPSADSVVSPDPQAPAADPAAEAAAAEERARAELQVRRDAFEIAPEGVDESLAAGKDFSSQRLLISGVTREQLTPATRVLSEHKGLFLVQFDSAEKARNAFLFYKGALGAPLVEPDVAIAAAEGQGSTSVTAPMSEDENPLADLQRETSDGAGAAGYTVALLDTGYAGAGVVDSASMLGSEGDDNGHGTAMAGYLREADPDARIVSVKVLDGSGTGTVSSVYAGIEYAIAARVNVINLSLSAWRTTENEVVASAIAEAVASGIIVVGAAGNNGVDASLTVPGGVGEALVAGACDESGARVASSNFGATVDVFARAGSTSEAAARVSGWLSVNEVGSDWQGRVASAIAEGAFSDGSAFAAKAVEPASGQGAVADGGGQEGAQTLERRGGGVEALRHDLEYGFRAAADNPYIVVTGTFTIKYKEDTDTIPTNTVIPFASNYASGLKRSVAGRDYYIYLTRSSEGAHQFNIMMSGTGDTLVYNVTIDYVDIEGSRFAFTKSGNGGVTSSEFRIASLGTVGKPGTVVFNGNGGSGSGPGATAYTAGYSYPYTMPANTYNAPAHKHFKEWNSSSDGTGKGYKPGDTPSFTYWEPKFYAIWEDDAFDVTLDKKGGTGGTDTVYAKDAGTDAGVYLDLDLTQKMTASANPITVPTRNYTITYNQNYEGAPASPTATSAATFKGYFSQQSEGTQYIGQSGYIDEATFTPTTFTEDSTIFAQWGDGAAVTLATPTREGYAFAGWYKDAACGDADKVGDAGAIYTPTADTELFAKWTPNTYNVAYARNDSAEQPAVGDLPTAPATATFGQDFVAPACALKRVTFGFAGWNTSADGSGHAFAPGTPATWADAADATLYAQWRPASYNLAFEGLEGAAHGDLPASAEYGTTFSVANPTHEGCDFAGWQISGMDEGVTHYYGDDEPTQTTTAASLGPTFATAFKSLSGTDAATVTFTATWTPHAYHAHLDPGLVADVSQGTPDVFWDYGVASYFSDSTHGAPLARVRVPKATGYEFGGYFSEAEGAGTRYVEADGTFATDPERALSKTTLDGATLHALWTPVVSKVTLDDAGGSGGAGTLFSKYGYGVYSDSACLSPVSATGVATPTFAHRAFGGYFTQPDGAGVQMIDASGRLTDAFTSRAIAADTTLFARWTPDVFEISLDAQGATSSSHTTRVFQQFGVGYFAEGNVAEKSVSGRLGSVVVPERSYVVTFVDGAESQTRTARYDFAGYFSEAAGAGQRLVDATGAFVDAGATTATASGTYHALWQGGSVSAPAPASREGSSFAGWRSRITGELFSPGDAITPTADLTLDAQWDEAVFEIALDGGEQAQAGTGSSAVWARYHDDVYTTRSGATPTYSGAMIADGAQISVPAAQTRRVTFDLQDPSETATPTMSGPTSVDVPFQFQGFFSSREGGLPLIDATGAATDEVRSTTFASAATIFAHWQAGTVELPTPSCAGMTFAGWSETPGVDGTGITGTYAVGSNVTLYAKWAPASARTFQVRYEGVEGLSAEYVASLPTTVYVDGEQSSFQVANPTRIGARFDGWTISGMTPTLSHELWSRRTLSNGEVQYDVTRCTGATFGSDDEDAGGITVATKAVEFKNLHDGRGTGEANVVVMSAIWGEEAIPITLDGQGATTEARPSTLFEAYDDGSSYVEPPYVDPDPDDPEGEVVPPDEGNFGIFLDAAFTSRMTSEKNPIAPPERTARVTYRANDGTGDGGLGEVIDVARRTFQFTGFYTLPGGSGGQVIDPQGHVTPAFADGRAFSAATTVFAGWTADGLAVREGPERLGLVFVGWNSEPDGSGDAFAPGDVIEPDADVTLYAQWTHAVFAIVLDAGEVTSAGTPVIYEKYGRGIFSSAACAEEDALASLPEVPSRAFEVTVEANDGTGATRTLASAWSFGGYFTQPDGAGERLVDERGAFSSELAGARAVSENATAHAIWTGSDPTLPTAGELSRTGFVLAGFNTAPDGSGESFAPDSSVGRALRLFAQWEPDVFEIALDAPGAEGGERTERLFERFGEGVYTTRGGTPEAPAFEGDLLDGAHLVAPAMPERRATYDAAGGTVAPTEAQTSARPSFLGYFTAASGGECLVGPDGAATPALRATTFEAAATLHAQWGDAAIELPTPTWAGHTFLGWTATDASGATIGSGLTGTYALPGDVTLTAAWAEGETPTYRIEYAPFDEGRATGVPAGYAGPTIARVGTPVTIAHPTRDHYVFAGWKVNESGDLTLETSFADLAAAGGTAKLEAHWTRATYEVSLSTLDATGVETASAAGTARVFESYGEGMHLDAACGPESLMGATSNKVTPPTRAFTVTFDANAAGEAMDVAEPAVADWPFEGFYTSPSGGAQVITADGAVSGAAAAGTLFAANATAYVRWSPASVTVADEPLSAATSAPREGWRFLGWNTAADGSGKSFSAGDVVTPEADMTLFAQWERVTYPITYNANGGSGAPASQDKAHGVDLALSTLVPVHEEESTPGFTVRLDPREGTLAGSDELVASRIFQVTFASWNTAADGSGDAFAPGATYDANAALSLFATWVPGAERIGSVTLPEPTREGYRFAGWTDENPYAADLAYLAELADEAQAALDAHTSAADRALTIHERPVLEDALATARGVCERQSASAGEIADATEALSAALWAFNDRFAPEDDLDGQADGTAFSPAAPRASLAPQSTWQAGDSFTPTSDVTLFATWVPSPYNFTLGSATGVDTSGSQSSGSYLHGSAMRVTATVAPGWVWEGWKSSDPTLLSDSLEPTYDFQMPAGDVTLTPRVRPASDDEMTFAMHALDFQLQLSEAEAVTSEAAALLAGARATNQRGEEVPFVADTSAVRARKGSYPVTFTTSRGTSTTVTCTVMDAVTLDGETDNVICADDVVCLTTAEVVEYEREGMDQCLIDRVHARARNVWTGDALPVSVTDRGGLCAERGTYPVTFHANPSATVDVVVCDAGMVSDETGSAIFGNHFDISSADVPELLTGDMAAFAKLLALAGVRAVDANGNPVAPMGVNVGALAPVRGTYDIVFYTEDGTYVVVQANVDGGGRRYRAAISVATRSGRAEEGADDAGTPRMLAVASATRPMARTALARTADDTPAPQGILLGLAALSIWVGCRRRRDDARQGR